MTQRFKQHSNVPVAIGFAGLIILSQLMVYNMGYVMPLYFLMLLGILTVMIVWGMIANDIFLDDRELRIKAGPFSNKIALADIQKMRPGKKGFLPNARAKSSLEIHYQKGKKFIVHPRDRGAFVKALKKQIPKAVIDSALQQE